jgi:acetyl esterase/lipase
MDSRKLVDSDLLESFHGELPVIELSAKNLKQTRDTMIQMMSAFKDDGAHRVRVTKRSVPGPRNAPNIQVIVYRPENNESLLPGILHMHGGGFVLGNAEMNLGYCQKLASDTGCVVVSVDYRLAPETHFPAPLEDCYSVLLWMHINHSSLGLDPERLAITGESSGGGLAASLAHLIRDRKEVAIALQFLTYPMLDDRTGSTLDPGPYAGEFGWTRATNQFAWSAALGEPAGSSDLRYKLVPARIENLKGLAPACLAVGALDLFVTETLRYAQRMMDQGITIELHVYPGALHGFDLAQGTPLSMQFFDERRRVFKKFLGNQKELRNAS